MVRIGQSVRSIDLVEEVDEFLKIYFVVWFRSSNLYHSYGPKNMTWLAICGPIKEDSLIGIILMEQKCFMLCKRMKLADQRAMRNIEVKSGAKALTLNLFIGDRFTEKWKDAF